LIEYGKSKGWDNYWEGEKLRQALLEIKTFDGCMGKITFDPKTGLAYRNLQLFEAVVDPDKPNMLKWKDIGGYTAQQVAEMEN
jgi:ABC-type branched-subunit amino acid transport system substrate-binding protein